MSEGMARVLVLLAGILWGMGVTWVGLRHDHPRPVVTEVPLSFTDADTREVTRWRCRLFDDGYEPRLDKCVQEEPDE